MYIPVYNTWESVIGEPDTELKYDGKEKGTFEKQHLGRKSKSISSQDRLLPNKGKGVKQNI